MPNVNVTYEDLNSAATQLRAGQQEMTEKLTQLQTFIQNLVSSGYVTDQSSVAFNDTYQQFTQGATQTVSALEGLATFLTTTAQVLSDTDAQLAQSIR